MRPDHEGSAVTTNGLGRWSIPDGTPQDLVDYCAELEESDHPTLGGGNLRLAQATFDADTLQGRELAALDLVLARLWLGAGDAQTALERVSDFEGLLQSEGLSSAEIREGRATVNYAKAIIHLRAAIPNVCSDLTDPEGCLLRIGGGTGAEEESVLAALGYLEMLLTEEPEVTTPPARWLLNIAHMVRGTYPDSVPPKWVIPAGVFGVDPTAPRFIDVARDVNVAAMTLLGGSIMEDFDNDGFLDLFTTSYHPCHSAAFYHNDGAGGFVDASTAAGVDTQLGGFNAMQTDYDNDGLMDIFIVRGAWQFNFGRHRSTLLRNTGQGTFIDVTHQAGLAQPAYPTNSAAWADFDDDGDLDLYIGNEAELPPVESPFPSQMFRNNGDGTFTDVAAAVGLTNDRMAKGVAWGDYDNDGDQDLYVSNRGPNRLYRNNGDGTFTDVAPEVGVQGPEASFAVWFWDYDNDGWQDLFVAGYPLRGVEIWPNEVRYPPGPEADYLGIPSGGPLPKLYRNDGGGGFQDVTAQVGLDDFRNPMGVGYGDIDGDGWLDFYLGTGEPSPGSLVPNVMYRNVAGAKFDDITFSSGLGHLGKGHGIAFGDVDNDGDEDIYVSEGGFWPADQSPNALFLNPGNGNHWLTVRLQGEQSNRAAIGARLRLALNEGGRTVFATVSSGGSFGASSLQQEVGLGGATMVRELEVWWPSTGLRQVFSDIPADAFIEITEGQSEIRTLERRRVTIGESPGRPPG